MKIPAPSQSSHPLHLESGHLPTVKGDPLSEEAREVWQRIRLGQESTKPLEVVWEELCLGS